MGRPGVDSRRATMTVSSENGKCWFRGNDEGISE